MSDSLHHLAVEPGSGLAYRIRPAQAGQGPAPCLLLLHGVGASETGFVELARRLDARLAVILVRGPLAFSPTQFGWFQVSFTPAGPAIDAAQAERSRAALVRFIGALPAACGIDPQRVWIAGFSQGGIMSAGVALTAPEVAAGFGLLSGRILPEVLPAVRRGPALAGVQAFVAHGVDDDKLGIGFARRSREVLLELGVPLAYHEYPAGHTLSAAMLADFGQWLGRQLDG